MKFNRSFTRARVAGLSAGCLFAGIAAATVAAPMASAAPDCSPAGLQNTVSTSIDEAQGYLSTRPEANRVVMAALFGPRGQAEGDLRSYFTSNPGEYYDLRNILSPIGEQQQVCGNSGLSPELNDAYNQFVAG